ncbi:GNAT family N-acetyltransferase [Butyrivibrio sp. CB08]|uniref:GNAT family N-acetyltransferase n=1 Tax=Butyrivibrio sp. CB08 TaxID=2364879 RepID=UPI000EA96740|nr:GNAT family N-acetyltransferase [Butyrivibrio sp. CB08]RKM55359.1 GNAT family N-acetyltransferase [Butyrivibrio sp. CB08]
MGYIIREATAADDSRIRELFIEMLQTIYNTKDVKGYEEGYLDRYWKETQERIFVAEDETSHEVIAYLSVEVHREELYYVYLDDLSVTESARNCGIGSTLIKRAEDYAQEIGFNNIVFHVEKSNTAAFRLYERLGYRIFREEETRFLMRLEKLYIKQLKPYLYLLDEQHDATGYIVVGEEKVCVIDTMNGYNDLHKVVREITDKPIIVVNTHGHPDHIFGNIYFDEAYMNPKDLELANMFTTTDEFKAFSKRQDGKMPEFKPIKGGDVIDLGGKTLEVYDLPGHTPGGIVLLLKEDRILFSGDSINHHLWMQLDGCSKMSEMVKTLDSVMFLEEKADYILHGHAQDFDDISLLRCMRNGAQEICDGKTEGDKPFTWFGGTGLQHPFELVPGKHYACQESVICYRKETL